ncbi:MAG TPA: hypothetical protein VML54_09945 [Candidatus Limnocylindrales bacterium]|nr:hypothetical protein [Candidatus Limnocylindrales bacterium]
MAAEKRPDVEDALDDLVRNLEMLQRGLDRCPETALAINKLKEARQWLSAPGSRRQRQDVGTSGLVRPWDPKAAPSREQVPLGRGSDVILVAPKREPATVAALAHRFGDIPGVVVVEDRRIGWDRRIVKGGRLFFSHRKGERRENWPPPKKGHFVGAIRWTKSVEV